MINIARELKHHGPLRGSEIQLHVAGKDGPAIRLLGLLFVPPPVIAPPFPGLQKDLDALRVRQCGARRQLQLEIRTGGAPSTMG